MTARRMTPDDLWRMGRVGAPSASRDGEVVVVAVTTFDVQKNEGLDRLHLFRRGTREPRALTSADVSSSQPCVSPDGRAVAFLRKPREKEKAQLHVLPLDGGEARCLTSFPLGASDPRWFPDGRRICVIAPLLREDMTLEGTQRILQSRAKSPVVAHVTEDRVYRFWDRWLTDGAVPHLFVVDVETGDARDILPESDRWFDLMDESGQYDIAPDGEEIVFSANSSRAPHARVRWAIFAAPVAGGPIRCLTPDNPADDVRPRYSPDGRVVVYGAKREPDIYSDRVRLVSFDRKSGVHTTLTEAWDRSPSEWEFADASTLAVCAEDRGRVPLFRLAVDRPGMPEVVIVDGSLHAPRPVGASRPGGPHPVAAVVMQHQSLRHPPELVRCDLVPGAALERVSRFNDALLAELDLGEVREMEFTGAEGDRVQMFVLEPPGFDPSRRWPLLHLIHGGPYGVFGDTWHFRWNAAAMAAPGYVCAMVNFHGSSSFGDGWARSILADWGGKPATDILRATDVLVESGAIDPARIAIAGGSYGGYMTCWLASQTDRFACAIAHAAVFDVPALYAGDITQGLELEFGGEPWSGAEGRAAMDRHNPAVFTAGFRTPMLVIHGEKDYRVPATQALQLYGVLKARGIDARLVYYPDENHWILKPQNSLHWYGEFQRWLARYLTPL